MTAQKASGRIDVYKIPDLGPFATEPAIASNATPPLVLDIIGDTGSDEALQWMKDKIAKCDLEHDGMGASDLQQFAYQRGFSMLVNQEMARPEFHRARTFVLSRPARVSRITSV